jgi:toxoflavin synthase
MSDSENYQYDYIASEYDKTLALLYRKYIEFPATYSLIGNVRGMNVLDLACGTGHYSRFLSINGAQTQGADISREMLRIAREIESSNPLGIQYHLADAANLGEIGCFDLTTAIYLFHYFQTKMQLLKCCRSVFNNLKNGGRFLTYTINPDFKNKRGFYRKYGMDIYEMSNFKNGSISRFHFTYSNKIIECYYWDRQSLEEALRVAGFQKIKWIKPTISNDGICKYGEAFWDDYLEYPRLIHLEAFKI